MIFNKTNTYNKQNYVQPSDLVQTKNISYLDLIFDKKKQTGI